ncbi:MAG TPA: hypothetical protein VHY18_02560 [Solirubrobacteraceae bacterium]|nr:hypothetical protein [Solirubrobacteraceae bacterium]
MESVQACLERGQPLVEVRGVKVAGLEGVLVAVNRSFGAGDLLGERCALFGERGAVGVIARGGLLDRVTDEPTVSVDASELGEDRGL